MLSLPGPLEFTSGGSKIDEIYTPGVQFVSASKSHNKNMEKSVLVIYTGGTIGMVPSPDGKMFTFLLCLYSQLLAVSPVLSLFRGNIAIDLQSIVLYAQMN